MLRTVTDLINPKKGQTQDPQLFFSLLTELERLTTLQKVATQDKNELVKQYQTTLEAINQFIQKTSQASYQKLLDDFIQMAPQYLSATRRSVFQLFIRHHFNPLSPQQFIIEFQTLLPKLLKESLFEDFAKACEFSINELTLKIEDKKEESTNAKMTKRIREKLDHARVFEVELQDLGNNAQAEDLQLDESKVTGAETQTLKKNDPAKINKLLQEWLDFVNKEMAAARDKVKQLDDEMLQLSMQQAMLQTQAQVKEKLQEQRDLPWWMTRKPETQQVLQATGLKLQQEPKAKANEAQKLKAEKEKKEPEEIGKILRAKRLMKQHINNACDPANWIPLFKFFTSNLSLNLTNYEYLFTQLQKNNPSLSIPYFIELLKKTDLRDQKNTEKRKQIIHSFFRINQAFCSNQEWLEQLFLKISTIKFYRSESNIVSHVSLVVEILQNSKIEPEKALASLLAIIKKALSDSFESNLLHKHRNAFVFFLDITKELIQKNNLNPFKIKLANGKSFFEAVLLQWQQFNDPRLFKEPDELVPHHFHHPKNGIQSVYQIKQLNIKNREDRLALLTHYVLWSELLPLLEEDQASFVQHFKNLFDNVLTPSEIGKIQRCLIESHTFELDDELFDKLKMAILNKLHGLDVQIKAKEFDLLKTVLLLLKKHKIVFLQKQFDTERQQYILATQPNQTVPENKEGQGGIGLLQDNNQNHLLISVRTVIQNQSLKTNLKPMEIEGQIDLVKMRYYFDGFVRNIFNRANFNDKEIADQLHFIPEMMCILQDNLQELFINHIFGEPIVTKSIPKKEHKSAPIEADGKLENNDQAKANVIFRMLCMYRPDPSLESRFNQAKQQIIKQHGEKFAGNPYFLLFVNNISPLFYERFKNPIAMKFILAQAKNPDLVKFANDHKNDDKPFDVIRLLDVPERHPNLLDENLVSELLRLKAHLANKDIETRQKSFEILARLLKQMDNHDPEKEAKNDDLLGTFKQHVDLLIHLGPQFSESFKQNIAKTFLLNQTQNPNLVKLAKDHKQDDKEFNYNVVRLLDIPVLNPNLLGEKFIAELVRLKTHLATKDLETRQKSFELLARVMKQVDSVGKEAKMEGLPGTDTIQDHIDALINFGPLFFESFDHDIAKKFILSQVNNPDLIKLAADHKPHAEENEFDLVRLLDIPKYNPDLLDKEFLAQLARLKANQINKDDKVKQKIFDILRNLLTEFAAKDADINLFQNLRKQIFYIINRFHVSDNHDEILSVLNKINGIILKIHSVADTNPLKEMASLLDVVRQKHLAHEDILKATQQVLEQKNPEELVRFIENVLNVRELTHFLTDEPHQPLLQNILMQTVSREAKISDAPRQTKNAISAQIIPALIKNTNSSVNFNVRLASGATWLEWAFANTHARTVLQLIEAGAEISTVGHSPKKPFNEFFIEKIRENFNLLANPSHRQIYKICLNGKNWIETLRPDQFIHVASFLSGDELDEFFSDAKDIRDADLLRELGYAALRANRFDLLEKIANRFKELTGRAIWINVNQQFCPHFDAEFHQKLGIPQEVLAKDYQDLLNLPGFFTAHQLIPVFYQGKYDRAFLEMGLKTKNSDKCTIDKAREYFDQIQFLQKHRDDVWNKSLHTQGIFNQIIKALQFHISHLNMQDIISIIGSLTALKVPANFPIELELTAIFNNPPAPKKQLEAKNFDSKNQSPELSWEDRLKGLHALFQVYSIKGKDIKEVEAEFLKQKPYSFDDIVCQGMIHHAVEVFKAVELMLLKDEKEAPFEILKEQNLKNTFDESTPGKWSPLQSPELQAKHRQQDVNFFAALYKASKLKLGKIPYHTQLITDICAMYAVPARTPRLLVDVPTNGGKTLILAFTAMCLMKQDPRTRFMPIVTTTENLAQQNQKENQEFYNLFGVKSSADVKDETAVIRYTISDSLYFKLVADSVARKVNGQEPLTDQDKTHWKLPLDETDVDLGNRKGNSFNALGLALPNLDPLIRVMWGNASESSYESFSYKVKGSTAYSRLEYDEKAYVDRFLPSFHANAYNTKQGKSGNTNANGSITHFEESTGLVTTNTRGGLGLTQFVQLANNQEVEGYAISHYTVPQYKFLNQFPTHIGYSGTVANSEQEQKGFEQDGYKLARTARFTGGNITINPPQIHQAEERVQADARVPDANVPDAKAPDAKTEQEKWVTGIREQASALLMQGRPVIIFVKKPEDVEQLVAALGAVRGCQKLNKFKGGETQEEYDQVMRSSVLAGSLTVASIAHTRGDNYQVLNKMIDDKGGLALIFGTVMKYLSLFMQGLNRTARGENKGEVFQHYKKSELDAFFKEAGMNLPKIEPEKLRKLMEEAWTNLEAKASKDPVQESLAARMSWDFYEKSKKTGPQKYRQFAFFLQKVVHRTASEEDLMHEYVRDFASYEFKR